MGRFNSSRSSMSQMQKLTNVEAQRIMAILEETYEKLRFLSFVCVARVENAEMLSELLGADVLSILEDQALLEQQYIQVSSPEGYTGNSKGLPDFETLDDELRHSTRVVCRMLKDDPSIVERMQTINNTQTEAKLHYLHTFDELKMQMYSKLSTTVEEEKSKDDYFLEISTREEKVQDHTGAK